MRALMTINHYGDPKITLEGNFHVYYHPEADAHLSVALVTEDHEGKAVSPYATLNIGDVCMFTLSGIEATHNILLNLHAEIGNVLRQLAEINTPAMEVAR